MRVIDLAEERRIAPRQVHVRFDAPVPAAAFDGIEGIRVVEADGADVRFETNGSVDQLVKALAAHTVLELTSREPTLEDLFRSLYAADGTSQ